VDTNHDTKKLFMYAILCLSLAVGLSSGVFSNYFKDVFAVDSVQRGLLEIPRETPGILCVVILTALSGLGNLSLMVMAYGFCTLGLAVLGLLSPSYFIMQIFLFSFSLGEHMMMPLRDSIAMDLSGEGKTGTFLGQLKGRMTLASMTASAAVFIGYRTGFFWFGDGVIPSFVAGLLFTAAGLFFAVRLRKTAPELNVPRARNTGRRDTLHIRKRYIPYYLITAVYGCQKRMRIVFAPWLIVELLAMGADTLALLGMAAHLIGSRFSPVIGRMLDRLGVSRSLAVEGGYFAGAFLFAAFAAWGAASGRFGDGPLGAVLVFLAYILVMLTDHFNTVHTVMMKQLSLRPEDVMGNLSLGLSVDHVLAVTVSGGFGVIWKVWGPQYVFLLAAACSAVHLAVAGYLEKSGILKKR